MNHETLSDLASLATLACFLMEATRAAWDVHRAVRKNVRKRMERKEESRGKDPENE